MLGLIQDSVLKKTVTTSEPMFSVVMGGKNGVVGPGQDPVLPTVALGHHGGFPRYRQTSFPWRQLKKSHKQTLRGKCIPTSGLGIWRSREVT